MILAKIGKSNRTCETLGLSYRLLYLSFRRSKTLIDK